MRRTAAVTQLVRETIRTLGQDQTPRWPRANAGAFETWRRSIPRCQALIATRTGNDGKNAWNLVESVEVAGKMPGITVTATRRFA